MIKEAIDRIIDLAQPNFFDTDSGTFCDKKLYRVDQDKRTANPVHVTSLTGFVQYVKDFLEKDRRNCDMFMAHVVSPCEVELVSTLDSDREREKLVVATAIAPGFPYGRFISNETMVISIQSMMKNDKDTDRAAVLRFAGTVTNGTIKEYGDDGVTQKATIKNGISSKAEGIVPSPCRLRPYRTFLEVEQPASDFIFRMRDDRNGEVESAIYEADGGAWKQEAMDNIRKYLEEQLEGTGVVVIA